MKKYIALVLAAVLVLGIFTGCGNKETESQTDEKATESVNSAEIILRTVRKAVQKIRMWLIQSSSPQKTDRRAQFLPVRQ